MQFKSDGLKCIVVKPSERQLTYAKGVNMNAFTSYVVEKEARIEDLPVPAGRTEKLVLLFNSGAKPMPGTATRFTIMTRQGQTVLGGSTYVLRVPAR